MLDEWLIYQRDKDYVPEAKLPALVAMDAKGYDWWASKATSHERYMYPVIARGLTETQAKAMIELTKEREDEI